MRSRKPVQPELRNWDHKIGSKLTELIQLLLTEQRCQTGGQSFGAAGLSTDAGSSQSIFVNAESDDTFEPETSPTAFRATLSGVDIWPDGHSAPVTGRAPVAREFFPAASAQIDAINSLGVVLQILCAERAGRRQH